MESAIGFLVVSYACFALSLAGLADPVSFGVLFPVLALLAALELRRITWSTIMSSVASFFRDARFAYTAWVYLSALLSRGFLCCSTLINSA